MEKKTKKEMSGKHWADILVDKLSEEKNTPYVITGGMTTSGPAHLGTICEFLYPSVIRQALKNKGIDSKFYFVGDILDAFDGIPLELEKYSSELTEELGKPLVYVKDPMDCHASLGEHYLAQAEDIMKLMSLDIDVAKSNELYSMGKFDPYAMLYLKNEEKTKEIVAKTSMKKIEELKDWSPIMPICEKCNKIATTAVVSHTDDSYEYVCNKEVKYTKGCGYRGGNKIADHRYKLQWRLHWPSWQAIFGSSIEGSGVDHMTRGGSVTTAEAVHRELLSREPPIFYKYGFIMINGKKYSKSKGLGMSAVELMQLIPQEMIKYSLVEPNLEQDKNIVPSGDKLIRLYEEVERLNKMEHAESRADEKKLLAFKLAIVKLKWSAAFVDVLLNYQIYKDWKKVADIVEDKNGVSYLSGYIEEWLKQGFEPERYNFTITPNKITQFKEVVKAFADRLESNMDQLMIHNLVYEVAKDNGVNADDLFAVIYTAIIGKDNGPRIGKFIYAIGVERTKELLYSAIN